MTPANHDRRTVRPSRRMLLGTGMAAVAAVAACSDPSGPTGPASKPAGPTADGPTVDGRAGIVDLAAFGAVGDGRADDTGAFARAVAAAGERAAIRIPPGIFRVTGFPELPDFASVTGAGADASTLLYDGDGPLLRLVDKHRVAFARMGVFVTGSTGCAAQLSNSFRCSFDSVVLRGNHTAATGERYHGQRGVILDRNTGGTVFVNCDINNFGVGLLTRCIQNYVTASKFSSNRTGVLGTGSDYNAGLSLTNVEFVSDGDPATTGTHLRVDGPANDWFLTNCWFEGCDHAIELGSAAGGPAQFGLINSKLAARTTAIVITACRQPYLANVSFDPDTGRTTGPRPLDIDPRGCPQGTAVNLISGSEDDVALALFPDTWEVVARHGRAGGTVLSPMRMRAPSVADSPAAAPVLRDDQGGYWRLAVDPQGRLTTVSLGTTPPR